MLGQTLGSLEGGLAKMLNGLFPIPILGPGNTGPRMDLLNSPLAIDEFPNP